MNTLQQQLKKNYAAFSRRDFIVLATIITLLAVLGFTLTLNLENVFIVDNWLNTDSHWFVLALVSFLLMILCAVTPLPAEAITVANGALFGPVLGTLITWTAAMLGATMTFIYGRYLLNRKDFRITSNKNHNKVNRWINRYGNFGFAMARLIPVVPFFALNIGAAFLPLSPRNYLLITGICILPHIVIICCFSGYISGH